MVLEPFCLGPTNWFLKTVMKPLELQRVPQVVVRRMPLGVVAVIAPVASARDVLVRHLKVGKNGPFPKGEGKRHHKES